MLKLIHAGHAYVCFYSEERIAKINSSMIAKKSASEYDKKFKELNPEESIKRMQNENSVVRLIMPNDGHLLVQDLIKGKLKFDYNLIEDPIIIKSDGFPTYHFANVIDDHGMEISHVIRGEEWLPSLPKHIHLYNCFGWSLPEFAHLPLLLNQDKSKLSKRQGDVAVEDYIEKGYLKEALINFVALLGWHESNNQEFYNLEELKDTFSLSRVQNSGAVFDVQKLNWLNQHYIKELESEKIIELSKKYISSDWTVTPAMIDLIKEKLFKISDLSEELLPFFSRPTISNKNLLDKYPDSDINQIVFMMVQSLEGLQDIKKEIFNDIMRNIASKTNCKGKNLWQPIRLIITGQEHGPDLVSFISIIGIKECIQRLSNAL